MIFNILLVMAAVTLLAVLASRVRTDEPADPSVLQKKGGMVCCGSKAACGTESNR
jgi:hypothetical protein